MAANVNNYVAAGRAAVNANNKIRTALAKGKPQVDKIGNAAITAAAAEKAQAFKNNAAVAQTAMSEIANITNVERKITADKNIYNTKKKARMAGMLAGGAALIGAGAAQMGQKDEENEMLAMYKDYAAKYGDTSKIDDQIAGSKSRLAELKAKGVSVPDQTTGDADDQNTGSGTGTGTGSKPAGGNATGIRFAKDLMSQGYSKAAAAAIAGNAQHESANFTAHEEYAPNSYGTKGAGFLQWTNAGGSNRRSEFESFTSSNKLDPTSYEASAGYTAKELAGGAHWTGGMDTDTFKGITDLDQATSSFMSNYLRPHKDHQHYDRRISNAKSIFSALD
jgi:hypothetical protein